MYARKRRRRSGPGGQTRDVLVQVLAERGRRADDVPALAADVGRRLGLTGEAIDVLVRAAELRDVGMIAVPHGAEDLDELHPMVGERILPAAESMRPVARIVRAAHERYDGSGFPMASRARRSRSPRDHRGVRRGRRPAAQRGRRRFASCSRA